LFKREWGREISQGHVHVIGRRTKNAPTTGTSGMNDMSAVVAQVSSTENKYEFC